MKKKKIKIFQVNKKKMRMKKNLKNYMPKNNYRKGKKDKVIVAAIQVKERIKKFKMMKIPNNNKYNNKHSKNKSLF